MASTTDRLPAGRRLTVLSRARPAAPRARGGGRRRWRVAAVLVAALCLVPALALATLALGQPFDGWPHFARHVLPGTLLQTVALAGGAAGLAALIGAPAAWAVTSLDFPGRRTLEWALILPLAVPTYLVAYCFVDLLEPLGPVQSGLRALFGVADARGLPFPAVRSPLGAVAVFSLVLYPYVYAGTRAALLMRGSSCDDAALLLGAPLRERLSRITLPLAWPAIAGGMTLVALEALNDIGAAEYLGLRPLSVEIATTWTNKGSLGGAAQLACLAATFALTLVALERRSHSARKLGLARERARAPTRLRLAGAPGWLAAALCALPVLLGFGVPVGVLGSHVGRLLTDGGPHAAFLRHLSATLSLTAGGALVAVALALVAALAARQAPGRTVGVAVRLSGVGYALPGTVLALGVLVPAGAVDNAIDAAARALFGVRPGLVLLGSGAALVFAYAVRFLPVALASLEAGLRQVPGAVEDAGRLLGAPRAEILRRVTLPMLRPALATAALLVLVDAMRELPATLLLRPFGVETLATVVYGHASRGAFEDAALEALAIVAVGLGPVIALAASGRRRLERAGRSAARGPSASPRFAAATRAG